MSDEMKPSQLQAHVLTGRLLMLAAQRGSALLDSFSGWLVAGFGATLALFIANLDTVSSFISLPSIRRAAFLFLVSALLAVVAKLLAAFIAAGTSAGVEGAAIGKELAEREIEVDFATLFKETERALFWPGSAFARRAFAKAQLGDFAGPGRMYIKVAQLQGFIVIVQVLLSLSAAVVVVCGLAV